MEKDNEDTTKFMEDMIEHRAQLDDELEKHDK